MTIYNYTEPFDESNDNDDKYGCSVDTSNVFVKRVDYCLWECYKQSIVCNNYEDNWNYSKKVWCRWPLSEALFLDAIKHKKTYWGDLAKYKDYDEYLTNNPVTYIKGDDYGMCQLYSLLDNFHSYYGAVQDETTVTVLSVGSCLHSCSDDYYISLSQGFGVVINKLNNDIHLISIDEDDGNYWGDHEIDYSNLSIYDRNEVISIVNEIQEKCFMNKQELIKKLWYFNKK